jgi:hypothetical protein
MDPTILVMFTACGLGFFALVIAMRDERTGRQHVALDENPYLVADPSEV